MQKRKYVNVDILACLEMVLHQNTLYYKEDFKIDKERLIKASKSNNSEDKYVLWVSRTHGTYCFRERDAFFEGTNEHSVLKYFAAQSDRNLLIYAVEITGEQNERIIGNLYSLDFREYSKIITENSIAYFQYLFTYEHGTVIKPMRAFITNDEDPALGRFISFEPVISENKLRDAELSDLLRNLRQERQKMEIGNWKNDAKKIKAVQSTARILPTLEDVNGFYRWLQGEEQPEGVTFHEKLNLSPEAAFSVIYYLQEVLDVFPDNYEQCKECKELFD